jgi:mono/diheme cytochrome c family protein
MKFNLTRALVRTAAAFAAAVLASTASAQLRAPNTPRVVLPEGPVKEVLRSNCVSCHGVNEYGFYSLSRSGWEQLINEKHDGKLLASMSSPDRGILLDYFENSFGKDYFAYPRSYQYQESAAFSNDDGRVFMEVNCGGCHYHGLNVAFNRNDTLEGWRETLSRERDRLTLTAPDDFVGRAAGRFSDDMLEKAAQWLSTVRGPVKN